MGTNLTDRFVDDIFQLSRSDFPEPVLLQAKRCLLDYLGVTFAGARMVKEKGNRLLDFLGETIEGVRVIGFGRKAGIENAAFINGLSAHVAELDDGVRFGMLHPGSPIISALLPIAEKQNITGSELISGIITGYEAAVRIACAIQPSHYNRGFHPTATCGTIGAAMGIASMLKFSKIQMKNALSSAAVSATGTLKVLEDGSQLKPHNAGHAAVTGFMAAASAWADFTGPEDALSGDTGFFSMMADQIDVSCMEKGIRDAFGIEKVYVKPYAACRHAHPAIEAAMKIRTSTGVRIEDIKSITVTTYHGVLGKHDHKKICGISSAKMSIPYSVAAALITGKAGIDAFTTEWVNHPEIGSLLEKVVVCADEKLSALVPRKRAAILEITTNDGNSYAERVDYPKGEPENPLSNKELEEKFISLAGYGNKPGNEIQQIVQIVWNLENELPNLFALL